VTVAEGRTYFSYFLSTNSEAVDNSLSTIFRCVSRVRDNFADYEFYCCGWKRPGGMPASSARAHKAMAVSGVSSDGLMMTVHPAASAGAIFLVSTSRKICSSSAS
jgi:hypothetical protein